MNVRGEIVATICFLISAVIAIPFLIAFQTHTLMIGKIFWLVCSAIVAYLAICKTQHKTCGNVMGTLFCIVLGPVALLTIGLMGIHMRFGNKK